MRTWVITEFVPMPDRQAGMMRLSHLLRFLASRHEVLRYARDAEYQGQHFGEREVDAYEHNLSQLGVDVHRGAPGVVFQRLVSKAHVTDRQEDFAEARKVKNEESSVYGKADVVIAISDADKGILKGENKRLDVEAIPLINHVPPLADKRIANGCTLMSVRNFDHAANSDAIVYFCQNDLPLVQRGIPGIRLKIIGNSPTATIKDLVGAGVQVLGYVPDITPSYASTDICIAPLTWGGGLKGKIAESMAHGLPVVTASVGISYAEAGSAKPRLRRPARLMMSTCE